MNRPLRRLLLLLLLSTLVLPVAPALAQGAGPSIDQWRSGQPALNETFSRQSGKWEIDSNDEVVRELRDGGLYMGVIPEDFLGWTGHEGTYNDFYLEVDVTHLAGPVINIMGVLFRKQDSDNFYMAMISSDGYAAIGAWTLDGVEWLHEWEQTNAVARGESVENRIGVLAVGSDIVFVVNDDEVARVRDSTFKSGEIALLAGTNKDEGNLEVSFDNLQMWTQARSPARRSIGGSKAQPGATATPGRRSLGPGSNTPAQATPTPAPAPTADAVVNSDTLNVRAGPGTNHRVIGQLKRGDGVKVTGRLQNNSWVKVAIAGQAQAWLSTQFLDVYVDLTQIPVAAAPAAPPPPKQTVRKDIAYLVIENHIGRYITVQVNDKNFRVEGKVGDVPGRYQFVLQGTGWYTVAAQLPNGGSHNWDLYVEPTQDKCAGRTGCVALGQTYLQTYF